MIHDVIHSLDHYFQTHWHWLNFVVIFLYLGLTTLIGRAFAGKQATIRDFFLGGKKLPWLAVWGSIIATEISAVTFIIVPTMIFYPGGNFMYLMLAFGTILARFIIGFWFVPVYYEKEIYSPYEYMGNKLGPRVDKVTSVLFFIGAILGQGVRVFTTALVLQVILGIPLPYSIFIMGLFSLLWTMMGGITTVIWTDVVQFIIFVGGGIAAFFYISSEVPGGFQAIFDAGREANKFGFWNLSRDPAAAFTLWCGLFGTSFLTLSSHGMDQMMAQRLFCCRNRKDAQKAIIWSGLGVLVTVIMLFVGLALFAYYKFFPLTEDMKKMMIDKNQLFAFFIVKKIPLGLSGFIISAVLAAAISTIESTLSALSQTSITGFYKPYIRPGKSEAHYLKASRWFVLFWGIALCLMALACEPISKKYDDIVQFALAMTSYTYPALLGTFLLAFLNTRRDDFGLMWGVPMSMIFVFALSWHKWWAGAIIYGALVILLFLWIAKAVQSRQEKLLVKSGVLFIFAAAAVVINTGYFFPDAAGAAFRLAIPWNFPPADSLPSFFNIAWPWNYPIGVVTAFTIGYVLGRKKIRNEK